VLELVEGTAGERGVAADKTGERERRVVDVRTRYREQETLMFWHTAPHSCAIYNKPREIRVRSRDKAWFADLWRRHGWDGEAPVTRVEMRYERQALHELGCELMGSTLRRLGNLWGYSTREWLRHTVPDPSEQRRRSCWPISPWWMVVQQAAFLRPCAAPAQRTRVRAFHEEQILATMLGYLESWSAWTACEEGVSEELDLSTALRAVARRADAHYLRRGSDFYQEVLRKRRQIGFVK
jgi:hypothetical protein